MKPVEHGKWSTDLLDIADDPATCLLGYCCPCVVHGQTAEKVHGGDFATHCLKFWLFSCVCLCGLATGPTRRAIRTQYGLPQQPSGIEDQEGGMTSDCLVGTIPCIGCFALCQDAREVANRGVSAPIAPIAPAAAPAAQAMEK